MRVKKQKQVRRQVRFYKVCFGFREPFKVLCDGNFVHQSLQGRKEPVEESLPKFLGGPVKPMVTKCVMAELRGLGPDLKATVGVARRLMMAQCGHEPAIPAAECIRDLVGQNNPEHYFVASQDLELRKALRSTPGAALLFAGKLGLIFEPPSEKQQKYARLTEAERQHLNACEAAQAEARLAELAEAREQDNEEGGDADKDTPQPPRKRKRAKGPNPLSMKKKSTKSNASAKTAGGELAEEAGDKKKHRARRRSRKNSEPRGDSPS